MSTFDSMAPNERRGAIPWLLLLVLLCASLPLHCSGQGRTWRITFDAFPLLGDTHAIAENLYYEQGMTFECVPSGFTRLGGFLVGWPHNGTKYIAMGGRDPVSVTSQTGTFGLVSVDLAEYSIAFQRPVTVPFIGYHPDGSTSTIEFTTDGIIDGLGPLADFETFRFDSRFENLTRVDVGVSSWSLDNMVVKTAVPEPETWMLLLNGAALLMAWRRTVAREDVTSSSSASGSEVPP